MDEDFSHVFGADPEVLKTVAKEILLALKNGEIDVGSGS